MQQRLIEEAWRALGPHRVSVFDFDGTLFKSPQKPAGWDKKTPWWHDPDSLEPPCVPKKPDSSWWNGALVGLAKKRISDPGSLTVLLTGRNRGVFDRRVKELLNQTGLAFDKVLLNPGLSTLAFKSRMLSGFLDQPEVRYVEVWDDHPEYTRKFQSIFDKRGVQFSIRNSRTLTRPALCPA